MKKRGPHRRLTTDRLLLRVNAVQRAYGAGGPEATLNTELHARPRDAWGSPPPPPPRPLPPPGPPQGTPAFGPPPVLGQQNHQFGGRTQNSQEDGAKASRTGAHSDTGAHRCHADDGFPASRRRAGRPPREKERPHTAAEAERSRRATRLETRPHSEPRPQERPSTKAAQKGPERHVNFQTSRASATTNPAVDPFRERGGFRLLTNAQLK